VLELTARLSVLRQLKEDPLEEVSFWARMSEAADSMAAVIACS
jgi:hypothetical protein